MSHALLLRLFLSPYFSISVAMHYLKIYPDSIGISHYLCYRMKSMPAEEVEFYWPQICHLLITRPTASNALESFVLQRAEESTHSAMLTFWFMQAALRDLTPSRTTNPVPFLICQRILHRCHEIIFGDPPEPSRSPYRSLPHSPPSSAAALGSSPPRAPPAAPPDAPPPPKRLHPHATAALIGMGLIAAGPALPPLTRMVGEWAVVQGRKPVDDGGEGRSRVEVDTAGGADVPRGTRWGATGRAAQRPSESESDDGDVSPPRAVQPKRLGALSSRSTAKLPPATASAPADAASFQLHPAQTAPDLHMLANGSPTLLPTPSTPPDKRGEDPFGQAPATPPPVIRQLSNGSPKPHQPFYSVPDFGAGRAALRRLRPDAPPPADALLATYSVEAQRKLLRSHYCRSEIRFLLLLEDISNRLLVIPKLARVSALRAELTSLNHNLPAEVCMPLWCAADHSHEEGGETSSGSTLSLRPDRRSQKKRGHSRVVRISPGDSVVLNSAEKAPYLLHVEILEGDLDFDPNRRENRELLKKIVVQVDMKRRKREGQPVSVPVGGRYFDGFAPMPAPAPAPAPVSKAPVRSVSLSAEARKAVAPEEIEEMDLVEQLYGNKLSVKDNLPEVSDASLLPTAPKNKQLDLAVWNQGIETPMSRRTSFNSSATPFLQPSTPVAASPNGFPAITDSPILRAPTPMTPSAEAEPGNTASPPAKRVITLEDYSERMRTAAVMLAQLNASLAPPVPEGQTGGALRWIPGTGWITGAGTAHAAAADPGAPSPAAAGSGADKVVAQPASKAKLGAAEAAAIRDKIMEEMMALEEERVARMTHKPDGVEVEAGGEQAEDEGVVRRELNKADPSAAVFKESWTAKKSRIRAASPWGHLANWDVISVIVKTGADLRQEQLATQLIERFGQIFREEKIECWVRFFRILITGETSGLVETITDAVSVHSIKKGEYARRLAEGVPIGHVSLMDHFVNTYGKPDSGQFARARRNFIKSLAGYSVVTYLLQIKDRHNGNILVDRDGRLIHIDFGFMLSNSPGGNMGFEAAPFKLPLDYVEIMGGFGSPGYELFRRLFKEGFEAARKHSDSLIAIVELMQKDSKLDCFLLFGEHTVTHFRERFALGLTTSAVDAYLDRLIVSSAGSNYTRLYDTFQYYSQGVL